MSAATAGARMEKTAKEGQELMDNFFKSFPKVKQLIEDSRASLKKQGYVEDWAGRRRRLTDYFLEPYEATYKDETKIIEATFNPIPCCENRPLIDSKLTSWIERAKNTKGNKAFDSLAKEALADGVILTANTGRIAQAERQCLNARIQGGAASLTKLAMVNVAEDEELKKLQAELIITVHDEVLVECPAFYADQVAKRLPQVMIDTAKPYITTVPMKCDPYTVTRWYADEGAVAIQAEFKELEKKGLSRKEAFKKLYENHPELPQECINNTIINGADLEF